MPSPKPAATIKHLVKDALPEIIYFDTSFIIPAIVDPIDVDKKLADRVKAAKDFVRRVVSGKIAVGMFSSVITEYWNIALLMEICRHYKISGKGALGRASQKLKDKPDCLTDSIKTELDKQKKNLEIIYQSFGVFFIIESCYDIHSLAYKTIQKYHLEAYDAMHVATMEFGKESNLVSFDKDFERCPHINLWCAYD